MNLKKFEYVHKDIPFLKKDILYRFSFILIFLFIFAWQFATLILNMMTDSITNIMIFSASFVMILSLLMFFCALMYIFKDFRIISTIKKSGRCVSSVQVLFNLEKRGFLNLYRLINTIISLLTALVLIASVTYSILEAHYYSSISYYLPILVVLCAISFNSVFHIKGEIKTLETVKQYHAIY